MTFNQSSSHRYQNLEQSGSRPRQEYTDIQYANVEGHLSQGVLFNFPLAEDEDDVSRASRETRLTSFSRCWLCLSHSRLAVCMFAYGEMTKIAVSMDRCPSLTSPTNHFSFFLLYVTPWMSGAVRNVLCPSGTGRSTLSVSCGLGWGLWFYWYVWCVVSVIYFIDIWRWIIYVLRSLILWLKLFRAKRQNRVEFTLYRLSHFRKKK